MNLPRTLVETCNRLIASVDINFWFARDPTGIRTQVLQLVSAIVLITILPPAMPKEDPAFSR